MSVVKIEFDRSFRLQTQGPIFSSATVDSNGVVSVGSMDDRVHTIETNTGASDEWQFIGGQGEYPDA